MIQAAFKLDFAQEARQALAQAPKVRTLVLSGMPRVTADEKALRLDIKRDMDDLSDQVAAWEASARTSLARLVARYTPLLDAAPLDEVASGVASIDDVIRDIEALHAVQRAEDARAIAEGVPDWLMGVLNTGMRQFVRRQLDRAGTISDRRMRVFTDAVADFERLKARAVAVIDVNLVAGPPGPEQAPTDYVDAVHDRPVDRASVAQRARAVLARFPKTSEYLGR